MGMSVDSECGRNVCVAEQGLNRFGVRSLTYEEARQRVTQIMEAEADGFSLFENARRHRSRSQMVLNQHVCDPRLFPFQFEAGKAPIAFSAVGRRLLP